MRLSARAATGIRRARGLPWVAVAALFLGGCFASERTLTRDAFVAAYACPKNQVSVQGDGATRPLEAVGCGHDVQYDCHVSHGAIVCTPVQSVAVSSASTAWSCPENRISVEAIPAPTPKPPADVLADPARLAIWQGQLAASPSTLTFAASGCGKKAEVSCTYSIAPGDGVTYGDNLSWSCFPAPDGSAIANLKDDLLHVAAEARLGAGQVVTLGPVVEAVRPDSSAGRAGLMTGDVILEVDHQPIGDDRTTAANRIDEYMHAPGTTSHLFHVRRGATTLDMTIEAPPRPTAAPVTAPAPSSSGQPPSPAPTAR
jgi:hypothetical protein